jgi:hypothetical protein
MLTRRVLIALLIFLIVLKVEQFITDLPPNEIAQMAERDGR